MAYVPDAPPAYSAQPASPNYGTAPPYASPSYNGDKAGEKAPLLSSPPQTVVTVVPVYNEVRFSEFPAIYRCPYCNYEGTTEVFTENGLAVMLGAGVCCLFGCWFGCCLIPFCIDGLKDVVHCCSHCHQRVGRFKRL